MSEIIGRYGVFLILSTRQLAAGGASVRASVELEGFVRRRFLNILLHAA